MNSVVVREYARLTTAPVAQPTLDQASIPETAFEWLCKESARLRRSGASLVQLDDRRWLRLDNYVGVIETPRSEEHTSELQSLMRISYAVFCLKKKKKQTQI